MVDWKTVRESIGYAQARQSKDAGKWRSLAFGYHAAAKVLDEHKDQIPGDTRPFALNAALSIELILKSILARKNIGIPQGSDGHDLIVLSEKVGTTLTESQRLTLELLTETIVWSGRYPAPKKEQRWDDYHDRILESHIVRNKSGNKSSAMANRDTFPNWETYARIWNACVSEFEAAA